MGLTVNVCCGHGEREGLCQLHFQLPLWKLCEAVWEIPACEQDASQVFSMHQAAVVLTLQPLCCAAVDQAAAAAAGRREKLCFAMGDGLESACNKSPVIFVPRELKLCWKAGWESPENLD